MAAIKPAIFKPNATYKGASPMYASTHTLRVNRQSMFFYVALAVMLAVFIVAP